LHLSLIIPVQDELENIAPVFAEVRESLRGVSHEIIFVDDGSTDGSGEVILQIVREYPNVSLISVARNFGQTAALAAGFKEVQGDVIAAMDADGQNNPLDLPPMLEKIAEGYDVDSGWRRQRRDPLWSRRIPSAVANFIVSRVTGVALHDFGCTLKFYRRSAVESLRLYGEMHRL
jgi:glycosyltransferase involved in cell wall biosynthesis